MIENSKIGDKVKLLTKDAREFLGTILPDSDTKKIVLKLASGYNIGLLRSNIKSIKVIGQQQKKAEVKKEIQKPSKILPAISIIHTGGTISSSVDYETGAVVA